MPESRQNAGSREQKTDHLPGRRAPKTHLTKPSGPAMLPPTENAPPRDAQTSTRRLTLQTAKPVWKAPFIVPSLRNADQIDGRLTTHGWRRPFSVTLRSVNLDLSPSERG